MWAIFFAYLVKFNGIADEIREYRAELERDHALEDAQLARKAASEGMMTIADEKDEAGRLSPAAQAGDLSLSDKSSTE